MKTLTHSLLMAFLLILGSAGCTKYSAVEAGNSANLEITASIAATKVAYSEDGNVLKSSWEPGDKVFGWWQSASDAGRCSYAVKSIDSDGVATLQLESGSCPVSGADVHMVYAPGHDASALAGDNSLSVSFAGQDCGLDRLGRHSFMAASAHASGSPVSLIFRQQTAVIEIDPAKCGYPAGAGKVVSYSVSGSRLGGSAFFRLADGVWGLSDGLTGEISAQTDGSDSKAYVNIPTTAEPTSLVIEAVDDAGRHYRTTPSREHRVEAGCCYTFSSLSFEEFTPAKKSISVLAIGNSFSIDAMEYLYPMLRQAGYDEVVLGNLYIGGCSLQTHADNLTNDKAAYQYYVNTADKWSSTSSYKASAALKSRKWDYVCMQQVSQNSGMPGTYEPYIDTVIGKVNELCPGARHMWHMTWAYQGGSTHSGFANYGRDQMTMYNAIVSTVKEKILTRSNFDIVIPSGTAVQNLRTSLYGDNLTRDGYHMSYNVGRFVTAMMWAKMLSGCDLADITYKPGSYTYRADEINAIKEAVQNAFNNPFKVTESVYRDELKETSEPNAELRAILAAKGYDLDNYIEVDLEMEEYAFYNSTGGAGIISRAGGRTDSNLDQFCATRQFSRDQLPNGTLIVQKSGYQYRPEGWVNLSSNNSSSVRPANTSEQIIKVNTTWWGSWTYRAFNISMQGVSHMTEAQMHAATRAFGIFVPKPSIKEDNSSIEAVMKTNGLDINEYNRLDLGITEYAYYVSTGESGWNLVSKAGGSTATNLSQFAATRRFTKSEIPVGSVIVQIEGRQYRPEGWQTSGAKNTSTRPVNVLDCCVVVDGSWWGNFNYRGFNLAMSGNPSLSDAQMKTLSSGFAIFVPKK